MAEAAGAITINYEEESVIERLNELTDGRGPDKSIDAVVMEAHTSRTAEYVYDRVKQSMMLESDRPHVLRAMLYVCRPAGILSVPGVYSGMVDKLPLGLMMNKGLSLSTGQSNVNRWTEELLDHIETRSKSRRAGKESESTC